MSPEPQAEPSKASPQRSAWIVSPTWDMAYIVATPLLIVPIVGWLAHRWVTPEAISLVVVAFASLGHHLPGFMRAYGDRELFNRFRWRFLFAPPVILITALVFAAPKLLTDPALAFGSPEIALSPSGGLSGLELIAAFWGTWHGLMQVYGFMRIYDLKRGVNRLTDARLDFALCLAIFACGVLFSQSRVYSVMEVLWQTGVPMFGPHWLIGAQWAIGTATILIVATYLMRMLSSDRRTDTASWAKLLLVVSTGGLYWIAGALTTNVLVGVAMFEIFHAVQYDAIVWVYNRQRRDRAGSRFGPLGFMFQDRWSRLGLYLAAIAAFGSLRYFSDGVENPAIQSFLLALFTTSTLLHYYYDGFIWKVSERKTQRGLNVVASTAWRDQLHVPGVVHFGKWAALYAMMAGLFVSEIKHGPRTPEANRRRLEQLAAWTPESPELLMVISKQKLTQGDTEGAITAAQKAFDLRPRFYLAASTLGDALHQAGKNQQALDTFMQATALKPDEWSHHYTIGVILLALDRSQAASDAFETVVTLRPKDAAAHDMIGDAYWLESERDVAIRFYREALAIDENLTATQLKLAAMYRLEGAEHLKAERYAAAKKSFQSAIDLEPNSAITHFQLGTVMLKTGPMSAAARAFRRATVLDPKMVDSYVNLGAAYYELGRISAAEKTYRKALTLNPKNAKAHYNLGLALLLQKKQIEAGDHLAKARNLGFSIPDAVAKEVGR